MVFQLQDDYKLPSHMTAKGLYFTFSSECAMIKDSNGHRKITGFCTVKFEYNNTVASVDGFPWFVDLWDSQANANAPITSDPIAMLYNDLKSKRNYKNVIDM